MNRVIAWQRPSETWQPDWSGFPARVTSPLLQSTSAISVASGELFIASTDERDHVRAVTAADAVDMNSFGLALVCAEHGVPLFSWKIISDHADENAAETFREFVLAYRGDGGKALAELIAALPPHPDDPASYPAIEKLLRDESR